MYSCAYRGASVSARRSACNASGWRLRSRATSATPRRGSGFVAARLAAEEEQRRADAAALVSSDVYAAKLASLKAELEADKPVAPARKLNFSFPEVGRTGRDAVQLKGIGRAVQTFAYDPSALKFPG